MKRRTQEITVGAFTLLAVVALILLTINLRQIGFFTPTYRLHLYFRDASGLVAGAPVTVYGVQAGTVRKMVWEQREYNGIDYFVDVVVEIAENIQIFEDAEARLVTAGLVGETNISVKAGSPARRSLHNGDAIYGVAAPTLEEQLDRLPIILSRAETVLGGIEKIVSDPETQVAVKETIENVRSISEHADEIAAIAETEMRQIAGDIGSLREEASAALARVDALIGDSEEDLQAALGAFRDQMEHFEAATRPLIDDATEAVASTRRVADRLDALVGNPDGDVATTVANLAAISAHIEAILADVRGGRGTIGRLFNDARLYEDLTGTAGSVTDILGVGGEAVFPPIPRDRPVAERGDAGRPALDKTAEQAGAAR